MFPKLLVIIRMFITSSCADLRPTLVGQLVNIITEKTNGGRTACEAKKWGSILS